jgi:hypothetical protein
MVFIFCYIIIATKVRGNHEPVASLLFFMVEFVNKEMNGAVAVAAVGLADSGPGGHVVIEADMFLIRKRIRLRGCSGRGPGGHIF